MSDKFDGFKKISQNEHITLLQHPRGHAIKVVHGALSKEMRERLEKMPHYAAGGSVDEAEVAPSAPPPPAAPASQPGFLESIGNAASNYFDSAKENPAGVVYDVVKAGNPALRAADEVGLSSRPVSQHEADVAKLGESPIAQGSVGSDMGQMQTEQAPGIGGAAANPAWASQMESGLAGEAKAQGDLGNAQANILNQSQQQMGARDKAFDQKMQSFEDERQNLLHDIQNSHIDPNRLVGNMGTGQKIRTAIGLILGGIGAGAAHQENPALKYLNQQIENDILAQKENIGKKQNLLTANLQNTRNMSDAEEKTRIHMRDMVGLQLKEAEARAMDPIAKYRLQQERAKWEMQTDALMAPIRQKEQVMKAVASGQVQDPAVLVPHLVPKEHQQKVFGEIEAAQNTQHMSKEIMKAFEDAAKENTVLKTGAGMLRTPGSVYALHQHMQPTFKDLEGTVRQAAMDNTFKNITPAPGDSEHTIAQKRQALEEYLKAKESAPTAKAYGIDLGRFQTTTTDRYKMLTPQQQQWAEYAKKTGDTTMLRKLGLAH